ncbi:MAG TPA: hypothetical protein VGS57_05395 [Thermoanaerobaculia bacterium]|nr:hypothetical protein [Thermoanaerobaculia bacterium]
MHLRADALSARGGEEAPAQSRSGAAAAWQRRLIEAAAAAWPPLSLLALTWALYGGATRLWWLDDDFFNLRFVRAFSPRDYCLDPAVWQSLPFRMLTPLLFVSYDADLTAFGAAPRAFYFHQLAALVLAAVALYALLRAWIEPRWALFAAATFVAGAPLANLATSIMARHYLECLALIFLAGVAWMRSLRAPNAGASGWWSMVSAVLWFAASLAKEIAVPLLLLLPLVPAGTFAIRLRRLAPHGVALAVYVVYRRFLMGALVGGYGWVVEREDWPRTLAMLPLRIGRELLGAPSAAAWIALVVLLAGIALGVRTRRAALLLGLAVLLALLPLVPVAAEVKARYAALPWTVIVVAFACSARRLRRGAWLAAAVAVTLLVANRVTWQREMARATRASVENQALLRLAPGEVLRQPAMLPASLDEAQRYGRERLGLPAAAGWFFDDLYLCLHGTEVRRLWEYDPRRQRLVDETARLVSLRAERCGTRQAAEPLEASFRAEHGVLHWRLGPYEDGRWTFVLRDGQSAFPVPRRGGFHLHGPTELPLYLRYDAPSGWTTYSPLLRVDLTRAATQRWSRPRR